MYKNKPVNKINPKPLWHFAVIGIILWTALVYLSLFWHQDIMRSSAVNTARIEARNTFQNQVIYRSWNAGHGGVYAPVTPDTQPNPFLNVPERDIVTPSGVHLTKINPAYMTRQANELGMKQHGYISHLTSLKPIRPENKPDEWETRALQSFEKGIQEVSSIEMIHQEKHMRLMKPLVTEQTCLTCHEKQGYKIGDIRGGISVAVPMEPHFLIEAQNKQHFLLMSFFLWIIGASGTVLFIFAMNRQIKKRIQAEEELRSRHKLDGVIEMARAVCHEMNQPLQTIMGNAEILMMDNIDIQTMKKRIQLIKAQADRMGKMTRKIIDIANYETINLPQGKVIDIEKSSQKSS